MKFLHFALFLAAGVEAFAPGATTSSVRSDITALEATTSRSEFLRNIATATTASFGLAFLPTSPASAAKYGPLGAGSPEVIDPKTAVIDSEILKSETVQKAIEDIRGYQATLRSMTSKLNSDGQSDIGPTIRSEFDFVKVRNDFNTAGTAFDEDTQRGTDRITRVVLQDITELEAANKQKAGVARSETRLNIMKGKIQKLDKAFNDYLAFFK